MTILLTILNQPTFYATITLYLICSAIMLYFKIFSDRRENNNVYEY